jgi:hypothetical protein
MSFAREGLPLIAIAALIAAGTYALALNRRSWSLWLLAFALTIAALWVAYFFSDPARPGPRTAPSVSAPIGHRLGARPTLPSSRNRARPLSIAMNELNVPVDRSRESRR